MVCSGAGELGVAGLECDVDAVQQRGDREGAEPDAVHVDEVGAVGIAVGVAAESEQIPRSGAVLNELDLRCGSDGEWEHALRAERGEVQPAPGALGEQLAIAGRQQLAPAPVAAGHAEVEGVAHTVQEQEHGPAGRETLRDVTEQRQPGNRVPPVARDYVPVVLLGDEHITGVELVDVGQEHQVGGMLLVEHDDLLPRGHRQRMCGQHVLALSGAAEPVAGQAALIAFVGFGVGQEEVDRPVGELLRPGQALMVSSPSVWAGLLWLSTVSR